MLVYDNFVYRRVDDAATADHLGKFLFSPASIYPLVVLIQEFADWLCLPNQDYRL